MNVYYYIQYKEYHFYSSQYTCESGSVNIYIIHMKECRRPVAFLTPYQRILSGLFRIERVFQRIRS